uniref:TSA: Wollemia nobilis Ref_Wollemi_Transcript_3961_2500 transcribed RNA sequence n=1 Tax=Wollemia nobilis TaxID=56998 RepID=A0A0C9RQ31_9CONI
MSLLLHVGLVFGLLWIAAHFGFNSPVVYLISFLYLYQVDQVYSQRVQRRIRHEERKKAGQNLLSDSETVRWLNRCMEVVWPMCMERVASQEILMPLVPWFLDKYKPWTAKKAIIQQLYLGRNPPVLTEMRALSQSADDDHMVLDLGLAFRSAEDMSAILAVQMRKRLGFGMWAKLHVTGMHVEGKVRVGVKFLKEWPFVKRVRVSFQGVPYFQMIVKPIFSHGLDVTELPGIAGWLDKILTTAFEQSLVEPNMLVVDVERLISLAASSDSVPNSSGTWFYLDEKPTIAYVILEILEGADMKPSDPNGLADPFIKVCLGTYQFKTKIQKKTLNPKWQEEFKIPISSWESSNVIVLNVRDKDHFLDDDLGECRIHVNDLRGGLRHDKWLPLENVKTGRLHIAVTVRDVDTAHNMQDDMQNVDEQSFLPDQAVNLRTDRSKNDGSSIHSQLNASAAAADEIESVNLVGGNDSPIWIQHPGNTSHVCKTWDSRKGKSSFDKGKKGKDDHSIQGSLTPTKSQASHDEPEGSSSGEEEEEADTGKGHRRRKLSKKLHRLRTIFKKDKGNEKDNEDINEAGRRVNYERDLVDGDKETGVKLIIEDVPENLTGNFAGTTYHSQNLHSNGNDNIDGQKTDVETHGKGHVKDVTKNILHQATHVLNRKHSNKESNDITSSCLSSVDLNSKDDNFDSKSAESKQEGGDVGHSSRSQGPKNNLNLERDNNTSAGSS